MASNQITLKPLVIQNALARIAVFFIITSLAGQIFRIFTGHGRLYGLLSMFNLDVEYNFPSYFSMFLLLSTSVLLIIITTLEKKRLSAFVSQWMILALGFLYISIDEIIGLHEHLISPIRKLLGSGHVGIFYNSWVIPGIAIVIIVALCYFKFLMHLTKKYRYTFCVSGFIYVLGAIGMEMLGGNHAELHGIGDITYLSFVTIEESLELFGVIIFIGGLLDYMADNFIEVVFNIEKS